MSKNRRAQEIQRHRFLYDLAGADVFPRHHRSPRPRPRSAGCPRRVRPGLHHALTEAGRIRIFAGKKSGRNAESKELWKARDCLRAGAALVVPSVDRLGRSTQDLLATVSGLRKRGIGCTSLHEGLGTTTSGGRLVCHVCAALAEFIRELIIHGTDEGQDAARARGPRLGHPPVMTEEQTRHARDLLTRPENTVTSIAKPLGVARDTIYKYVPELKGGRAALGETTGTPALPRPAQSAERSPPTTHSRSVTPQGPISRLPSAAPVPPAAPSAPFLRRSSRDRGRGGPQRRSVDVHEFRQALLRHAPCRGRSAA
ncbi:recombinase family protein [Streptomyces sp. IMTB 2501]|uniref:recombinase family protein n=1 Tax=Streptomyces sp. IMTB 2501 TaxID=1776340 RepID=UPI002116C5F8|nr:recombinase family protein [Streptomyces sp. IMTB 2501]